MERWRCPTCGYIYDPDVGEPEGAIEPDTPFAEIPLSWFCPDCGAGKAQFEKVE